MPWLWPDMYTFTYLVVYVLPASFYCARELIVHCWVPAIEFHNFLQTGGVMSLDTASGYRPRTQETRAAYEAVLAFIREQFDDQPQDVLKGAADEVLAVLKDDRKRVARHSLSTFLMLL